jgi:PAS domain S-box-containing protein
MKKQNNNPEEAANLRQKAEELLHRKDKACLDSTTATEHDVQKLIHELEVHQIELEMQNEELVIAKEKAELAEEKAKLAEEKYTELYDFAPSGYVVLSKEGEILKLNFAAASMLGKERIKLIENRFALFVSIDTQMTFNQFLQDIFTSKIKQSCEVIIATEDNFPISVNIEGIVSQNDEFCLLTVVDITERKLIEDTQAFLLQISNPGSDENFFESLAKYLSQCLNMEYVCIDILEGDSLTAKTLAIYNEGNFDPNVSYALKDTPCGEVVGNHICCYPQQVRSLFPNDAALEDIKAESYIGTTLWSFDGQPIGLIAVIGQKPLQNQELAASILKLVSMRAAGKLEATLAEEKVRESEEKFRVLIESNSVAIYLSDLNGKCTYVNPKWCEMAHLNYKEALGDGWVNGIYEEDRDKVFGNWDKMIASDGNWGFEYRFGTPAKISWVYGTAKSYKNDSGQIAGFIGSNVDITERKHSEKALLAKMDELERFFKITVGRETSMVALKKEVNNLLNKLGQDNKYTIHE